MANYGMDETGAVFKNYDLIHITHRVQVPNWSSVDYKWKDSWFASVGAEMKMSEEDHSAEQGIGV